MCVKVTKSRDHYQSVFLISYYMYMQAIKFHLLVLEINLVHPQSRQRVSPLNYRYLIILYAIIIFSFLTIPYLKVVG